MVAKEKAAKEKVAKETVAKKTAEKRPATGKEKSGIEHLQQPAVIIGQGEMGGVFARGLLRVGYPIIPVTRGMQTEQVAQLYPDPHLVLVAVAENDLQPVLTNIPATWAQRLVLLQNELLPLDWRKHDLNPTVISVWFEKKKGQDFKVIIPSPVFGPHSQFIAGALDTLGIPCRILKTEQALLHELIVKNLYILTANIAGLRVGGTVSQLWSKHESFTRAVAGEVLEIQSCLTKTQLDEEMLIESMLAAFAGDPEHKCMGRSAVARLETALQHGETYQLPLPVLKEIKQKYITPKNG